MTFSVTLCSSGPSPLRRQCRRRPHGGSNEQRPLNGGGDSKPRERRTSVGARALRHGAAGRKNKPTENCEKRLEGFNPLKCTL